MCLAMADLISALAYVFMRMLWKHYTLLDWVCYLAHLAEVRSPCVLVKVLIPRIFPMNTLIYRSCKQSSVESHSKPYHV